jgi:hypothetical protein
MTKKINIDGIEHDLDACSSEAKVLLERLKDIDLTILELQNVNAIFRRARKSYFGDLKREIVRGKSGIDIASLFE